jgi:hypothetical protein
MFNLKGGYDKLEYTEEAGYRENDREMNVSMTLALDSSEPGIVEKFESMMERWSNKETVLRLTSAPGKMSMLSEDADNWIPIPRTAITSN